MLKALVSVCGGLVTQVTREVGLRFGLEAEEDIGLSTVEDLVSTADATLCLVDGADREADRLGRRSRDAGRPWMRIEPDLDTLHPDTERVVNWIQEHGIRILHVYGFLPESRGAPCRGLIESVAILSLARGDTLPIPPSPSDLPGSPFPDVESVVTDLMGKMPLRDRVFLANMQEDELQVLDHTLGIFILGNYLWPPNPGLLVDCAREDGAPDAPMDDSRAVRVLLQALWSRLARTHKLRIMDP